MVKLPEFCATTVSGADGEVVPMPIQPLFCWMIVVPGKVIPPAKVLVAVVVATILPMVTCDDVAAMLVPSNHRRPEERALALVPPFAIGRIPVTSAVNEMSEFAIAPTVALRNPEILEMVRPPEVMLIPPLKVEVAVEEA